ncbi:hypothetical protein MSAN_00487700 [Mycena sanguinolenta]|uniref:Uncharacterized protein n=1 Tax=Mycena sanguinolenta TaxID=230812 RepID=A0A8H6Z8N0_9AGAR|nr:hypothetical protein MSAN_00487700 [Mycena sanguinolenta]
MPPIVTKNVSVVPLGGHIRRVFRIDRAVCLGAQASPPSTARSRGKARHDNEHVRWSGSGREAHSAPTRAMGIRVHPAGTTSGFNSAPPLVDLRLLVLRARPGPIYRPILRATTSLFLLLLRRPHLLFRVASIGRAGDNMHGYIRVHRWAGRREQIRRAWTSANDAAALQTTAARTHQRPSCIAVAAPRHRGRLHLLRHLGSCPFPRSFFRPSSRPLCHCLLKHHPPPSLPSLDRIGLGLSSNSQALTVSPHTGILSPAALPPAHSIPASPASPASRPWPRPVLRLASPNTIRPAPRPISFGEISRLSEKESSAFYASNCARLGLPRAVYGP